MSETKPGPSTVTVTPPTPATPPTPGTPESPGSVTIGTEKPSGK